jgi:hypothetical protein
MKPTCVYCDSHDNLNTQLTVSLDNGTKVTVYICDGHAEDASVKTARIAYQEKQAKIEAFLEQAKALGIEIQLQGGGLTVAQQTSPTQQVRSNPMTDALPIVDSKEADEGWVSTAKIDGADRKGMRSIGGSTELGAVPSHASYNVSGQKDVLDEQVRRGKVKMGLAAGRAGTPIAVPEKRVDGTGTTRIRIVNKETDDSLQRRFKNIADESRQSNDNSAGPDFRHGYNETTRTCPICRGDCVVNDQDCPKCQGLGVISVY